jgi:hypothetical protein
VKIRFISLKTARDPHDPGNVEAREPCLYILMVIISDRSHQVNVYSVPTYPPALPGAFSVQIASNHLPEAISALTYSFRRFVIRVDFQAQASFVLDIA